MKKLITIMVAAFAAIPMIVAQETFTGVVVDKDNNPLPGVRIEIPGTPDQAISDLDGTFTITRTDLRKKKLLASYAGMTPKKVKLKEGMRIKMKEYNWWTKKPDEWNWFAEAIFAVPNVSGEGHCFNPAYGLMLGRVKKFGYYIKGVTNTFGNSSDSANEGLDGFMKKQKTSYWSVSGGGIIRLGSPIHLYAGVGFANYGQYLQDMSGKWYRYDDRFTNNFVIDLGFMLRIKKVTVSFGTCLSPRTGYYCSYCKETEYEAKAAGNFGIGYSF